MKILITGSNGLIGQYLVEALANVFSNHNNTIYDAESIHTHNPYSVFQIYWILVAINMLVKKCLTSHYASQVSNKLF